jgi:hypothetical protein
VRFLTFSIQNLMTRKKRSGLSAEKRGQSDPDSDGEQKRPAGSATCFLIRINNSSDSYSPTTETTKIAAPKTKNDDTVIANLALAEAWGAVASEPPRPVHAILTRARDSLEHREKLLRDPCSKSARQTRPLRTATHSGVDRISQAKKITDIAVSRNHNNITPESIPISCSRPTFPDLRA